MRIVCMALAAALGLAGCIGSPTRSVNWIIDSAHAGNANQRIGIEVAVGSVSVRMPYDSQRITVLRPDGSVAFDPVNTFAAAPSKLIKSMTDDICVGGGGELVQVNVTMLALDCRKGKRTATVSVELVSGGRVVGRATARRDAAEGNYSKAFSEAVAEAIGASVKVGAAAESR